MIRLSMRVMSRLGLRWMLAGAVTRHVIRRASRATVARATADLETKAQERLPAPLANAVSALPPEAKQIGGSALVAGRAARGAMVTTRRVGGLASSTSRRAPGGGGPLGGVVRVFRAETEAGTRRLRAQYLGRR